MREEIQFLYSCLFYVLGKVGNCIRNISTKFFETWVFPYDGFKGRVFATEGFGCSLEIYDHISELFLHVKQLGVNIALYPLILFSFYELAEGSEDTVLLPNMKLNLMMIIVLHDDYYIPQSLNFLSQYGNLLIVEIMQGFCVVFGTSYVILVAGAYALIAIELMILFGCFAYGGMLVLHFSSLRFFLGNFAYFGFLVPFLLFL